MLNELSQSVTTFAYHPETGRAERLSTAPALSEKVKAEESFNSSSEIIVHPNGRFIYTGNRGHDSVTAYEADIETGELNVIEVEPIRGSWPRNINMDVTGRWLLAAGRKSHTVAAFEVDPRFEVNAFATEEEFPEIACPIAMRWDNRGRLWVSTSKTYPHVYPGDEPNDTIVILEDTDKDGKADKSTVFAEGLHIPLSFVLTDKGCYVSDQPHLVLLEDLDGDDKADKRTEVLTGFGTEDSHHSLHDFQWTPDGDLVFRESIFHNSQVETAYGPVRAKNSAWFRFTPRTQKLPAFGSYPNTNPWGVTYDQWGNHIASHPFFATAFHALNPPYPEQQPKAAGIPAYSGVCGHEFVDFPMWPEEMQGGMVKVRYKPTNRVEFHRWVKKDDHYTEEYETDIVFSTNLSFIPVDLRFGPRGAMYVCDWYNPV